MFKTQKPLPRCKTSYATILLGCPAQFIEGMSEDRKIAAPSLYLFPSESSTIPGLTFSVQPLVSIETQMTAYIVEKLSISATAVQYNGDFLAEIRLPNKELSTLYLAKLTTACNPSEFAFHTLTDLLRNMPSSKNRISYLKVMQVFMGFLEEHFDAVEFDDKGVLKKDLQH